MMGGGGRQKGGEERKVRGLGKVERRGRRGGG